MVFLKNFSRDSKSTSVVSFVCHYILLITMFVQKDKIVRRHMIAWIFSSTTLFEYISDSRKQIFVRISIVELDNLDDCLISIGHVERGKKIDFSVSDSPL